MAHYVPCRLCGQYREHDRISWGEICKDCETGLIRAKAVREDAREFECELGITGQLADSHLWLLETLERQLRKKVRL